ncbi:unnamed protein product [Urochloa decumbens]|uniref:FBD domain-containing protein n=1 Tax=Urochloa decumbens TaxID=240449 RepID=A0ABC9DXZ1_9POAL
MMGRKAFTTQILSSHVRVRPMIGTFAVPSEPPGAEMEAADPPAKKRRTEAHVSQEPDGNLTVLGSPHEMHLPSTLGATTSGEEEDGGVDYISRLPDAILGEIISLLPTKAGVRTQTLASRWRRLWLSAPLNLDLSDAGVYWEALSSLISVILGAHPGPSRRFSIPLRDLKCSAMTIDAWLRSPALDNLQELDLEIQSYGHRCPLKEFCMSYAPSSSCSCGCLKQMAEWLLPASTFRFSATLRVVSISKFHIVDGMVEALRFPQLTHLGLEQVKVSDGSLHSIIACCPVIECLLLKNISCGYDVSLRINSPSLISFGFDVWGLRELIIEDAPSLKRLFQLRKHSIMEHVLVSSAPNLEIVGSIYEGDYPKFKFGDTVIQKLRAVTFTTAVSSVKTLAIDNDKLNLDLVIDLMQCFPRLENLYIKTSNVPGGKNLWRRKYHAQIKYLDIRLKTIVLTNYRGIKSQASFATFFILNAKMLQVMRFEGGPYKDDAEFIARQQRLLQLEKRASRRARFEFSTSICHCDLPHIKHVHDLSKADPFKCIC